MYAKHGLTNPNDALDPTASDPVATDWHGYRFRRQWILAPEPLSRPGWRQHALDPIWLASHPDLPVITETHPSGWICLLGTVFDPQCPSADDATIVSALAQVADREDDLEAAFQRLSGRWVLIVATGAGVRIYPDATGARSVFYASQANCGWAAASPNLLNEYLALAPARELSTALDPRAPNPNSERSDFWPGMSAPFVGMCRLLPNQYLDLTSATTSRFWPRAALPKLDVDTSARRCFELLQGTFTAALARDENIYLGLTAGYDSRVLLAASVVWKDAVNYFALAQATRNESDRTVPRQLASIYHLRFLEHAVPKPASGFVESINHSTGGMVMDGALDILCGYLAFPDDSVFFEGTGSEIGRARYYQRVPHPRKITAEYLCNISGFRGNPVAKREYQTWLETLPDNCPVNILDLFHWEIRLGGWCSSHYLGQDLARNVCSPYNSHAVLSTMLGAPDWARQAPFRLHRAICNIGLPGGDRVRFNNGWHDRVRDWMAFGVGQLLPTAAVTALRAR